MTTFGYQPIAQASPLISAPVPGAASLTDVSQVQRRRGVRRGFNRRRGFGRRRGFRRGVGVGIGAAIIGGAIIGGAIAAERRRERRRFRRGVRHERWCFNRFNSYRAFDNSYMSFSGVRRQCRSPFF